MLIGEPKWFIGNLLRKNRRVAGDHITARYYGNMITFH